MFDAGLEMMDTITDDGVSETYCLALWQGITQNIAELVMFALKDEGEKNVAWCESENKNCPFRVLEYIEGRKRHWFENRHVVNLGAEYRLDKAFSKIMSKANGEEEEQNADPV